MSHDTSILWGKHGRGDLHLIKTLGANAVRLYGNNPEHDHTSFLNEAYEQSLHVIAGMSDYPYIQMPGNCATTNFNCYTQIKSQYAKILGKGFLGRDKQYHKALDTIVLMNEPDLKFLPVTEPEHFCKSIISALDAVLDAEKEAGLDSPHLNFTVTFSFGICQGCSQFGNMPALGQMMELRQAMRKPKSVGYSPKNDLWKAYQSRFINSFNSANPAEDIKNLFLGPYDEQFPTTPVFIGEFHSISHNDPQKDIEDILKIAGDPSNMLRGISFFEFQTRYDKGGSEMMFGMFGLGDKHLGSLAIGGSTETVWCLSPMKPPLKKQVEEAKIKCSVILNETDYVIGVGWGTHMDEIQSPEACCGLCGKHRKCKAWTWVADAHLPGTKFPSQCWLKGIKPPPECKRKKHGFVSGLRPQSLTWSGGQKSEKFKSQAEITIPTALAKAFGGHGFNVKDLCPASTIQYNMMA